MNLKKLFTLFVCFLLVFQLAGCGETEKKPTKKNKKPKTTSSSVEVNSTDDTSSDVSAVDSQMSFDNSVFGSETEQKNTVKLGNESVIKSGILTPLYAGNDARTRYNPDRGFRGSTNIDVFALSLKSEEDMEAYVTSVIKEAIGQDEVNPGDTTLVMQNYMYLTGFCDRKITNNGLKAIKVFFSTQKKLGIKGQPRFCYIFETSQAASEDATQEMTLAHIDQLAQVIPEIKDCIQAFPICFVGAWGEWHSDYYKHNTTEIAAAVMEKLVVPNGLYGLMRLPNYKNLLKAKAYYNRIGIENDSFFGKVPASTPGISGTGGLDDGSAQWTQLINEAAFAPQEGELYWNSWFNQNKNVSVSGYDAVLQLSEHRFTTLSIHHSYLDVEDKATSQIGKWKNTAIMTSWLKNKKVTYDPNWFKDKDGKTVQRNVFEFVRDHLGYRIVGEDFDISGVDGGGQNIKVKLSLKNYGLSAAFNMKSGFAILDSNNKIVSRIDAGNPEQWYNRNPNDYSDYSSPTYNVESSLTLPKAKGHYKLAFYLVNSAGQYAALANNVEYANGFNVLHTFDVWK